MLYVCVCVCVCVCVYRFVVMYIRILYNNTNSEVTGNSQPSLHLYIHSENIRTRHTCTYIYYMCVCLCLFKCMCVSEVWWKYTMLIAYCWSIFTYSCHALHTYTLNRFSFEFTRHIFIKQCVIRLTISTLLSYDECVCVCNYVQMKLISSSINVQKVLNLHWYDCVDIQCFL